MNENQIAEKILDAAFRIHRELGPGLLESVYETILVHQLDTRGLAIRRQVRVPIAFEGLTSDEGFRADLIVAAPRRYDATLPIHQSWAWVRTRRRCAVARNLRRVQTTKLAWPATLAAKLPGPP